MTVASGPAQETLRLAKLQDYNILDTLPESAYNEIVELVAHICQAPTALVSLIDANRQWFKAKVGLEDITESPRDIAFCAHTIQNTALMVVEDTHESPLFRDNPLVTGPPYIRFYAGAPLLTPDGYALGSLCVIDYQPRQLSDSQLQALEVLSHQVISQMELRRQASQLQLSNEQLERRVQERTAKLSTALHRLIQAQSKLLRRDMASRQSSLFDPLTGLPNRSYFLQRLEQAIQLNCRQPSHLYAVLCIDLDDFRPINDTLGHEVGDRLLQFVVEQMKIVLRKSDLVVRLGGDEFAILLDDIADEAHAIAAVKRLQAQLKQPFITGDRTLFVGASIGVTLSSVGYRQPEAALRDADTAMYHAKQQAKRRLKEQLKEQLTQQTLSTVGTASPILIQDEMAEGTQHFAVFDRLMQGREQARITLEDELRQALLEHQFHLYYQPIIDLNTHKILGLEVLLRWHHPTRGCLEAEEFIVIAEEIGIIRQLCGQMVPAACQQLKQWQVALEHHSGDRPSAPSSSDRNSSDRNNASAYEFGETLSLHFNLSFLQLSCPLLIPTWKNNLEKYQLPATAFQLE
ncbi:MAG: diguanylate cyclase, partial [Cyanobacteria bacterium J06635_11]